MRLTSDSLEVKKLLLAFLAIGLFLAGARADESVKAAQAKLRKDGFYFGNVTGVYDNATAAAVTRFQIRRGLAITGQFDAATVQALGVPERNAAASEPSQISGTWKRLRNGDMQFLEELRTGEVPPPKAPVHSAPQSATKGRSQAQTATPPTASRGSAEIYDQERVRDFVGAFVLAGLDPQIGAELEFFAERVDYFGEADVNRAKIRSDLLRYGRRWPQRQFRLGEKIDVENLADGSLRVTFRLRYELRSDSERASGEVFKTLVLRKAKGGDLEIVSVNERKS